MMFSYKLGVTHVKKTPTVCPQLAHHVLLITNVFINRIAKPLEGRGLQGGAQEEKNIAARKR
jgi:hypothetical protein